MKTIPHFMLSVLIFSLWTCQGDSSNSSTLNCSLETSKTIEIPLTSKMMNFYKICQYKKTGTDELYIGFNNTANQLEIIDLKQKKTKHIIPFEKNGPKGISRIKGLYYQNQDSIFLVSTYKIVLTNIAGEIQQSYSINKSTSKIQGIDFTTHFIAPDWNKKISYNSKKNQLLLPTKYIEYDQWSPEYYQQNLAGSLNLSTLNFEFFPIHYPKEYQENSYGMLNKPNLTILSNRIIYTFPISSQAYVYDIINKKTSTINIPTSLSKNIASPYQSDLKDNNQSLMQHLKQNPDYKELVFNPYQNVYSRFFMIPSELNPGRSDLCLSIINNNFEVLWEGKAPLAHFHFGAVPTPDGLMTYVAGEDENKSQYNYLNTNCIK